jgi:hypothetical protein
MYEGDVGGFSWQIWGQSSAGLNQLDRITMLCYFWNESLQVLWLLCWSWLSLFQVAPFMVQNLQSEQLIYLWCLLSRIWTVLFARSIDDCDQYCNRLQETLAQKILDTYGTFPNGVPRRQKGERKRKGIMLNDNAKSEEAITHKLFGKRVSAPCPQLTSVTTISWPTELWLYFFLERMASPD